MVIFWALLCGLAFAFGDTFTRLGVRSGTPYSGAVISSVCLTVFFALPAWMQDLGDLPLWPGVGWFLAMGIVATGPGRLLFYASLRRIGVSRASILVLVTPLVGILFAAVFLGERPGWQMVAGTFLIVIGLLNLASDKSGIRISRVAAVLGFLPTIFFSIMPLFMRLGMQSLPSPILGTFLGSVGALAVLLAWQGAIPRKDRWGADRRAFGWFVLAAVGYSAAFFTYYVALGMGTVSFVTPLVFTSPLFAMLISRLFFQELEQVSWKLAAGGVVVFAGVVLISMSGGG